MRGLSGKEWVLLSEVIKPDEDLIRDFGFFIAQILANRKAVAQTLDSKLKNLAPPFDIPNIQEAVEIIKSFVLQGKRIVLFGDYDVDGITGTAILYDLLKKAGAKVLPVLPTRRKGYGLTPDLIYKLEGYADLLITIDNGTTAIEELSLTKMPTIVLDHHNPDERLPPALIVNPKLSSSKVSELKDISSSGLAFYVAALLRRELDLEVDVREYLHLACLGTVADVMPMNFINRIIVSNGIRLLNYILKGDFPAPGLRLLMERSGIRDKVSSRDIAFSLAPRLNAPGRLHSPYPSLRVLIEKREDKARYLADKIEKFNQERRYLSQVAFETALEQAKHQKEHSLIIVKLEEWAGGVAGIVAGRLANIFSKPAIVLSVGREHSTASVRGIEGMDIYSPLKKLSHFFIKWGGHSSAAGFTIRTDQILDFEREAKVVFAEVPISEGRLYIDMELPLERVGREIYQSLLELEPFGEGFPEPYFLSEPLNLNILGGVGRMRLKAKDFYFLSWDAALNNKLLTAENKPRRVVYQLDKRRPNTLLLVDVEE
ncbi:MAG: single-stranded-DNA-specific exonuclease RecJ [Aquificaceae bacterium]